MGGGINLERNGCESIGCWTHSPGTHYVTLSYDLDLGFSRSNFEKAVSQEGKDWLTGRNKRDVSWLDIGPTLWIWILASSMTLTLSFKGQILKNFI